MTEISGRVKLKGELSQFARRVLLAGTLAMTLRVFQYYPILSVLQQVWYVLCLLAYVVCYPCWKLTRGLRFTSYEIYIAFLIMIEVLLVSWRTQAVFGQPPLLGALNQRWTLTVGAVLLMGTAMRAGKIKLPDLEAAILYLAWGMAALHTFMRIFINPALFASTVGFVIGEGSNASFTTDGTFTIYGVFYYALRGVRTGNRKDYIAALILFPTTLSGGGRGITIFIVMTILIVIFRQLGWWRATMTTLKGGSMLIILAGMAYVVSPSQVVKTSLHFSDAFSVVLTGSPSEDASASVRIIDIITAWPYIVRNPWLGNGSFSARFVGWGNVDISQTFSSGDIGMIGSIFSFGILGTLLFMYHYRYAWRAMRRLPSALQSPFLDATKAMLLYTALSSLETAKFVWTPDLIALLVMLLLAYSDSLKSEPQIAGEEAIRTIPLLSNGITAYSK